MRQDGLRPLWAYGHFLARRISLIWTSSMRTLLFLVFPSMKGLGASPASAYGPRDFARRILRSTRTNLTEGFYYIDGDRTFAEGQALGGRRWT